MDLQNAIRKIDIAINTLRAEIPLEMERSATDAIQMIQTRIQEKGKDADNSPLRPYTEPYLKRKKKAGKYRGFTDMTYSGQMMASIGIVDQKNSNDEVVIRINGRDQHTRLLLDVNSERRKPIIKTSAQEQKNLNKDLEKRIGRLIKNLFA